MKNTITVGEFRDTIRTLRPDNFSYNGLMALFEYLVEFEEDTVSEIDFDPIALCCEFSEYELDKLLGAYPDCETIEDIIDNTQVIEVSKDLYIIANF